MGRVRLACWIAVAWLVAISPAVADPWADYVLHCQGCHGPRGEGSADGAPPFAGQLRRLAATPTGREYLVRVPGVANAELDDERLAVLLNWLVEHFDGSAEPVRPFTSAEVARGRREPLLSVPAARRAALAPGGRENGSDDP
ncbi:MAG: hypothetical protein KatS3mg077_1926 [Candidatus Binatia bacterium]|nr:MAG: hypothetical protein KatS3mg077_1926 [Candidatus Binatia bacterium]